MVLHSIKSVNWKSKQLVKLNLLAILQVAQVMEYWLKGESSMTMRVNIIIGKNMEKWAIK